MYEQRSGYLLAWALFQREEKCFSFQFSLSATAKKTAKPQTEEVKKHILCGRTVRVSIN